MKKILTIYVLILMLFSINIAFAKDNSNIKNDSSNIEYTSQNEKIHIIASNNIKKVKWDKQFIDYTIIDENIIKYNIKSYLESLKKKIEKQLLQNEIYIILLSK